MFNQKNQILLLNSNFMEVEKVLDAFIENINGSNLSQMEKEYEINLARQVFRHGAMQMDVIRNAIGNTKYYKAYGYIAGYSDIPIQETPEMRVNGFTSFLGNLAPKLTGLVGSALGKPELGQHFGNQVQTILGTDEKCGVLGGLFNTKKCREKQQAQAQTNPLIKPAYVDPVVIQTNPVVSQPSQQTIQQQVQPQVEAIRKEVTTTQKEPEKSMIEKYWWVLLIVAYFMFFKKGKKMF